MNKADEIQIAIENILGTPVDDYQMQDICHTLEIECPTELQAELDLQENISCIEHDIRTAASVDMGIEEWYEACNADHRARVGYDSKYFTSALEFYREHRERFE